jgi:enoyl-CoA hydratase/carnithine racemase
LWIALADALTAAGNDREVRAVVISGAGGAFCSGADISIPDDSRPMHKLQRLTDLALALHELPVPTIAKVNGVAVGAGWNLALGCDLVVATPESTFFPDLRQAWIIGRSGRILAVTENCWPATGEAAGVAG